MSFMATFLWVLFKCIKSGATSLKLVQSHCALHFVWFEIFAFDSKTEVHFWLGIRFSKWNHDDENSSNFCVGHLFDCSASIDWRRLVGVWSLLSSLPAVVSGFRWRWHRGYTRNYIAYAISQEHWRYGHLAITDISKSNERFWLWHFGLQKNPTRIRNHGGFWRFNETLQRIGHQIDFRFCAKSLLKRTRMVQKGTQQQRSRTCKVQRLFHLEQRKSIGRWNKSTTKQLAQVAF